MRVRTSFSAWSLGLILVLAAHAQTAHAQAAGLSDRMLITDPSGIPIFDFYIPEQVPGTVETSLTFDGSPGPVAPIPLAFALSLPGTSVVVLTEPANDPVDPTAIQIVMNARRNAS